MLFLSYSREDQAIAERLSGDLVRFGREVWFDQDLEGGADWWDEILERIRGCEALLFLVSEGSAASRACRSELGYALALNRLVIPVAPRRHVEEWLPAELASVQVVGYIDGTKDEVAGLLRALSTSLDARPLPDPLPPAPALPASRYTRLRDDVRVDRLDGDQQAALVLRLRQWWQEEGDTIRARELVDDLSQRPDLLASVEPDVQALGRELAATGRTRRFGSGWSTATRAERIGLAIACLAVLALLFGQLTADLYAHCRDCEILGWDDSNTFSSVQYLVLGGVIVVGLVASSFGRARRLGAVTVLAAGVLLLLTARTDLNDVARDTAIFRFGSGLWWTVLAGLLAVVAGVILLSARSAVASRRRR